MHLARGSCRHPIDGVTTKKEAQKASPLVLRFMDAIYGPIPDSIFDVRNLRFSERAAYSQLTVQLLFRAFLRGNHLLVVIGRGEVRLEHDIVEQLLAGCEQDIDLCASGIVFVL